MGHHQIDWTAKELEWKCNSENMSCDFYRMRILSDDLNVIGSLFQMIGGAPEKARLLRLSLILRTESCCRVDDPSCLAI